MNRSASLQGLSATAVTANTVATPIAAFAGGLGASADPKADAWTLGFQSMNRNELSTASLPMQGKLPAALRGVLYRNGPARHDRGGMRYHHWFDGDGMVHAYRFGDSGISHHAQYVQTEKFVAEEQAGKFTRSAFGTNFPGVQPPASADSVNAANTSVVVHADELLALWEGGSAYRLDPESLQTLGPKTWRADTAGMPFSAHPKVDKDGTLWNFGTVGMRNLLVLYRISSTGNLQQVEAIPVPDLPMIHDFAITERHLVFLLPPFKVDPAQLASGKSIAESYAWKPERGMRILTVDKDDWSQRRIYETDSAFVFHFGNAWEDRQGVIRLSYMRAGDHGSMRRGFEVMEGKYVEHPGAHISLMTINPAGGRISEEQMPEEAEFPAIDPRHVGQRYRQLVTLARDPGRATYGYNMVQRRDLESGTHDRFDYGPDMLVEEHILVPDLSSTEGSGWIVGTALDLKKQTTLLSVFNAMALHEGPVAQATLPYALPLGLHGTFRQQTT